MKKKKIILIVVSTLGFLTLLFIAVSVILYLGFSKWAFEKSNNDSLENEENSFPEQYSICVTNDSSDWISIRLLRDWDQRLRPYENSGVLTLIYYIPKKDTITWQRKGKEYSEDIYIKKLLGDFSNVSYDVIHYIITEDNHVLVRYKVDNKSYFLVDDPQYRQLREDNEKLIAAVNSHDIESVRNIIEGGVSVNPISVLLKNPLRAAVKHSCYNIAELLLEYDATPEPLYFFGDSALTIACSKNNLKMVKLLISKGADINHEGHYPLSEACQRGHYEIAKFLIEKGANPNPSEYMSQPPMACAIRSQNPKIFELLLDNGVSLDTEWSTSTFRDYAYERGGDEIVAIIKEYAAKSPQQ